MEKRFLVWKHERGRIKPVTIIFVLASPSQQFISPSLPLGESMAILVSSENEMELDAHLMQTNGFYETEERAMQSAMQWIDIEIADLQSIRKKMLRWAELDAQ